MADHDEFETDEQEDEYQFSDEEHDEFDASEDGISGKGGMVKFFVTVIVLAVFSWGGYKLYSYYGASKQLQHTTVTAPQFTKQSSPVSTKPATAAKKERPSVVIKAWRRVSSLWKKEKPPAKVITTKKAPVVRSQVAPSSAVSTPVGKPSKKMLVKTVAPIVDSIPSLVKTTVPANSGATQAATEPTLPSVTAQTLKTEVTPETGLPELKPAAQPFAKKTALQYPTLPNLAAEKAPMVKQTPLTNPQQIVKHEQAAVAKSQVTSAQPEPATTHSALAAKPPKPVLVRHAIMPVKPLRVLVATSVKAAPAHAGGMPVKPEKSTVKASLSQARGKMAAKTTVLTAKTRTFTVTPKENAMRLARLEASQKKINNNIHKLRSNVNNLTNNMQQLVHSVGQVNNSVHRVNQSVQRVAVKISRFTQQAKKRSRIAAAKQRAVRRRKAMVKTRRVKQQMMRKAYYIQAIMPGRAWLRSNDGETLTVSKGDTLPGYGRIMRIDSKFGIVTTSLGRIIRFGIVQD